MKFKCKYHNCELVESPHNPKEALICKDCKKEKHPGRDGIFFIEDLKKAKIDPKFNDHIIAALNGAYPAAKNEEDDIVNIYDNPDWDYYDGF